MRIARSVALGVALSSLLAACGSSEAPGQGPDEAADVGDEEVPQGDVADAEPALSVVATLAPVADLVRMVGGERVEVTPLVPPGADSHTYEPRPGDVATLAEADLYLGVGLDLNPGAVRLAEEHLPQEAVVLLGERELEEGDLVFDHTHGEDGAHTHGEDGGHTHDDDGGHTHDEDGGPGPNPHVWTSLRNAAVMVEGIADTLAEHDPDGRDAYQQAADQAREQLHDLDERIGEAVGTIPAEHRTMVVYHDAWSAFARDHGLQMVTAVQPSDFSEPSAGEVRDIIDLVREHDVPAVFGSEVFPSDVLDAIAEETGATYVADLEDDVLPGEPGDPEHSYLALMRRNGELVVEGLGGDASAIRR